MASLSTEAVAAHYPTHKPAPPHLKARAIAPTVIRVEAQISSADRIYQIALVRTGADGSEWRSWISKGFVYEGHKGSRVDPARAGVAYTYRGMAESGSSAVPNSDWSEPISVTTPPEPTSAPSAPTRLKAQAASPFTVDLRWNERSANEYGFEVQRKHKGQFVRVALIDPDVHQFRHHGRRPGETNMYRVRAFNPRGVSEFTNVVGATTPLIGAIAVGKTEPPSTCTTSKLVQEHFARMWGDLQWDIYRHTVEMGRHTVDLFPDFEAGCCGAQNGLFKAFAHYGGCYRDIGAIAMFVDGTFDEIATSRDGWPIIRTLTHWRCGLGRVLIYRFVRGHYVKIDDYMYCAECGEEQRDVTAAAPPFCDGGNCDVCQEDLSIDEDNGRRRGPVRGESR